MDRLYDYLCQCANAVRWRAWALSLPLPREHLDLSRLRGVWGAALRDLDADLYRRVFEGVGRDGTRRPLYVVRAGDGGDRGGSVLECVFIGAAVDAEEPLLRAWDLAGERGIGKERRPFCPGTKTVLAVSGPPNDSLYAARHRPARLTFRTPLRLLRRGKLIAEPTLRDVALAALRRLHTLCDTDAPPPPGGPSEAVLQACDAIAVTYEPVQRGAVERYSARQGREVRMRCVLGGMEFPGGFGPLSPLFHAVQWLHIGKGATIGMGQVAVEPGPDGA